MEIGWSEDQQRVIERIDQLKSEGKTIIMASGCFDLLHVGHMRYFQASRELGDFMVVLISDDSSVRAMKGEGRPIISAEYREEMLLALAAVDAVIVHRQMDLVPLIRRIQPDIFTKGQDYESGRLPWLEKLVPQVAYLGGEKADSTSDIIQRCARVAKARKK